MLKKPRKHEEEIEAEVVPKTPPEDVKHPTRRGKHQRGENGKMLRMTPEEWREGRRRGKR